MTWVEVEELAGVGWLFSGLIQLWKCVEKSEDRTGLPSVSVLPPNLNEARPREPLPFCFSG